MYKYLIEYMGSLVIVTSLLLTEADPIITALVYYAALWMSQGISNGFFNPLAPLVTIILGRGDTQDMLMNIGSQIAGAVSAAIIFKPTTILINQM